MIHKIKKMVKRVFDKPEETSIAIVSLGQLQAAIKKETDQKNRSEGNHNVQKR